MDLVVPPTSSEPVKPGLRSLPHPALEPDQLDSMKAQLDLVLLAIEALAEITSDAVLQAAVDLDLASVIPDRVALWRLRQASPLRQGQGRKRLDIDEARSLVLISCHLAQLHQELIRRAVGLLEQLTAQGKPPHRAALLGDYIDRFSNAYQDRMRQDAEQSSTQLMHLALKLLIDLLFYSTANGPQRLWLALLERAKSR